MPVNNGIQFLEEINKDQGLRNIPVIIFLITPHAPTIKQEMLLKAKDFIIKPSTYNDLVNVLKPILL